MLQKTRVLHLFTLHHASVKAISKKVGLSQAEIKRVLVSSLGREAYLTAARRNGGHAVFSKLKSKERMNAYRAKMSSSVSKSLLLKMRENPAFRMSWRKKAAKASFLGTAALRRLLASDEKFAGSWREKCRRGGLAVLSGRMGIHNCLNHSKRRQWSILGLKNTGKKAVGPKGEKMYNTLEVRVAEILCSMNLDYEYEKLYPAKNANGFVSVDFVVGDALLIEATNWDKPGEKAGALQRKFGALHENMPRAVFVVVTSKRRLMEYRKALNTDINVCCLKELSGLLQSLAG